MVMFKALSGYLIIIGLISIGIMVFSVACQVASAMIKPLVIEPQDPAAGRENETDIKIDQVSIVGAVSLCAADAMRVMTSIAGGLFTIYVCMMPIKRNIIGYGSPAMAAVTKGISG